MNFRIVLHVGTALMALLALLAPGQADAQGTAFTYQGRLNESGAPAGGTYDLQFALYDAPSGGNAVGGSLANPAVPVREGLFQVTLDFGPDVFAGAGLWLEIGVRTNASAGDYVVLAPRQALTATPYAVMANNASNLLGTLPATQLRGSIPASQLSGAGTNLSLYGSTLRDPVAIYFGTNSLTAKTNYVEAVFSNTPTFLFIAGATNAAANGLYSLTWSNSVADTVSEAWTSTNGYGVFIYDAYGNDVGPLTSFTNASGAKVFDDGNSVPAGVPPTPVALYPRSNGQANACWGWTNLVIQVAEPYSYISGLQFNGSTAGGTLSLSNMLALTLNVKDYGAVGDGVHDDSAAFQKCVDLCVANQAGVVFVPNGIYLMKTWRPVTGGFAQIALPDRPVSSNPIIPIRIYGAAPAAENLTWDMQNAPVPVGGSVILCTNDSPGAPKEGCIIGMPWAGGAWAMSAIDLHLENLTFRTAGDPQINAVNLSHVGEATVRNVTIDTVIPYIRMASAPTHGTCGLILPQQGNWQRVNCYNVTVGGYAYGIRLGEHLSADGLHIARCLTAFDIPGGYLGMNIGYACVTACRTGILASASAWNGRPYYQRLNWGCYAIEHSSTSPGNMPEWTVSAVDIQDDYGYLRGRLNYVCTRTVDTVPLVKSASCTNLMLCNLNDPKLDGSRIQNGTLSSASFDAPTAAQFGKISSGSPTNGASATNLTLYWATPGYTTNMAIPANDLIISGATNSSANGLYTVSGSNDLVSLTWSGPNNGRITLLWNPGDEEYSGQVTVTSNGVPLFAPFTALDWGYGSPSLAPFSPTLLGPTSNGQTNAYLSPTTTLVPVEVPEQTTAQLDGATLARLLSRVPIIYDHDPGTDTDDAIDVAFLCSLQLRGYIDLLALTCSVAPGAPTNQTNRGIAIDNLICDYYGVHPAFGQATNLNHPNPLQPLGNTLAATYPSLLGWATNYPSAVRVLRQAIARSSGGVVLVVGGPLSNVRDLLQSGPDDLSNLNGWQLLSNYVKTVIISGGNYPTGLEYNFYLDAAAAGYCVSNLPCRTVYSSLGSAFVTLASPWIGKLSTDNPVYRAVTSLCGTNGRPAWSQVAIWHAVTGTNWLAQSAFSLASGFNTVAPTGVNTWLSGSYKDAYLAWCAPSTGTVINQILTDPAAQSGSRSVQLTLSTLGLTTNVLCGSRTLLITNGIIMGVQ
jgi:hypothetical protein